MKKSPPLVSFSSNYMMVHIYLNEAGGTRYYDTVLYRKIRKPDGSTCLKRGANLKPSDLPDVLLLISEAQKYLDQIT